MEFNVNDPILYVIVGIIVAVVMAQSIFFLVKAWRRGKELGMDVNGLKRIAKTAAIFTIAPAIAIVIAVITLAKDLGVPLPWLRLSVIGSLSYETIAASNALSAMGKVFGQVTSLTAKEYVTVAGVMTISIMVGIWLAPVMAKKLLSGVGSIEGKDKKWGEILMASMFIGMISAFIGYVFCDVSKITTGDATGFIPVLVFFIAAAVMVVCGILVKKKNIKWLGDYALPISMVIGMVAAIPITAWLS